jgi:glutamine synthetase
MSPNSKKIILDEMEKYGAKYLILQFTGADGHLKGVEISKNAFAKADQIGVDGSAIGFLRTKRSDMIIEPDPLTVTRIPWQDNTTCVFCDLRSTSTHEQISSDPRGILARVTRELKDEYQAEYFTRPEMEFYVLTPDFHKIDSGGYMSLPPKDKGYFLRKLIVNTLDEVEVPYKTFHSEVGPGQHEVEFEAMSAIRAADNVQFFKQIAKMVALEHTEDWIVSFMPKPFINESGTGMHIHQMISSPEKNLFKGSGSELSEFALYFIGGQLHYASEMAAITNPIINSYRRLVPGIEAPVYKTWGVANRTALIRVPGYEAGRLEYRSPDAATNIYFTLALLLAAGLEGVRRKLDPPEEAEFDADTLSLKELKEKGIEILPRTLEEALEEFRKSKFVENILGSALHQEYYDTRLKEWDDFCSEYNFEKREITKWEIEHYCDC